MRARPFCRHPALDPPIVLVDRPPARQVRAFGGQEQECIHRSAFPSYHKATPPEQQTNRCKQLFTKIPDY